jgi:paraquat-inducible protein B
MTKTSARSTWYFWLFPIVALGISLYLMTSYIRQRGPIIRITLDDGSGIQAEKTRVRFRGVNIGQVKNIKIAADHRGVVVEVMLDREAKEFAVEGSRYWVVIPKVGFQGISGLETIVEGVYIAAQPGPEGAKKKDDFKGATGGESSDPLEDTVTYYLETDNVGSVSVEDNITFRGMKVGTVSKINLAKTSQTVILQINIENRFVKLIRENTAFWRKTAVQAKLGLFNSELKISSLDALLHGGIEIFSPNNVTPIAKPRTKFPLLSGPPKGSEKWNPVLEFQ